MFDATHVEVERWFAEGLVDGVRIDHPDGLADPAGYLAWLRDLIGPDAWIVIEKILAVDEALDPTLPVAGTTGYDALREIGGVFVDPTGKQALTELSNPPAATTPACRSSPEHSRRDAATDTLGSELGRLRRRIVAASGTDHPHLPDAVAALLSHIAVYRSRLPGLAAVLPPRSPKPSPRTGIRRAAGARRRRARTDVEPATRLQQLCGAVTAKSVEDCLFYRDARLVSLNEVGGEPERFGVERRRVPPPRRGRARLWPPAMTTLSTHDTKRGEDVRARIGVLSQVPSLWAELVGTWSAAPPPDAATGLFLWQNIFGVWPTDGVVPPSCASGCTPTPRRRSGRPRCTPLERPGRRVRGGRARLAGHRHRRPGGAR